MTTVTRKKFFEEKTSLCLLVTMMSCGTKKFMEKFVLHPILSKSFKCKSIYKLCLRIIHEEPDCLI